MDNALRMIILAVGVIITAALIATVVLIQNQGTGIMNQGKTMLTSSLESYTDAEKTQYDGAVVTGSQVIQQIEQYWNAGNTTAILVCTKDGANIMYDYDGNTFALLDKSYSGASDPALATFPSNDATKDDKWLKSGNISKCNHCDEGKSPDGVETYDSTRGYNGAAATAKGFINETTGTFIGSCQRDANDAVRCITFVQQ